jgi:hypothetical protein
LHQWRLAVADVHDGRFPAPLLDALHASVCAPGARCDYLAHYDMNHSRPERRAALLRKIEGRFPNS